MAFATIMSSQALAPLTTTTAAAATSTDLIMSPASYFFSTRSLQSAITSPSPSSVPKSSLPTTSETVQSSSLLITSSTSNADTIDPTQSTSSVPRSSGNLDSSTIQSATSSSTALPSANTGPSLSAGAGAGIAIAVLLLLLGIIGATVLLLRRRRRRRLQARTGADEGHSTEKPQLEDTSVLPQLHSHGFPTVPFEERQELEASLAQLIPTPAQKSPAELRAGPYSNRHELEGRHR